MSQSSRPRHFPYKHPTFGTKNKPKPVSSWKGSVYYWWWAYLKRNASYIATCENGGAGVCAELYADFGDVRSDDFKVWWTEGERGARLFAEPQAENTVRVLNEGEQALSRADVLTLSIPLNLPRKLLEARFKELLDAHHKGRRGVQLAKNSRAKYKVQGQPNIPALEQGLAVYDARMANPDKALWQIGNEMPGVLKVQKIKPGDSQGELTDKKRALAATVSRYLKRVKSQIDGAGRGVFP